MSTPQPIGALALTASILEQLAALALNPVLGGLSMAITKFAPLLGYVAMLVRRGDAAIAALAGVEAQIRSIVTAGVVPSDEDWADWDARHAAAKARLQA